MSLYDAAKDAVKLAQKIDNVELIQKLLDVQSQALEMQQKQFDLHQQVERLQKEINSLNERKKYIYEAGHTWFIDPERPDVKLCPVCLNRDGFENPTHNIHHSSSQYCSTCTKTFT